MNKLPLFEEMDKLSVPAPVHKALESVAYSTVEKTAVRPLQHRQE